MDKDRLIGIASKYMSESELKNLKRTLELSRDEYLTVRMEELNIVNSPQTVQVSIMPFGSSVTSDGYKLFSLYLENQAFKSEMIKIDVSLDGCIVGTKKISIDAKSSTTNVFSLHDFTADIIVKTGSKHVCHVVVTDVYGRDLLSSDFEVVFKDNAEDVLIISEIQPMDKASSGKVGVAIVRLESKDCDDADVSIAVLDGEKPIFKQNVHLKRSMSKTMPIEIVKNKIPYVKNHELLIRIASGNTILDEYQVYVDNHAETSSKGTSGSSKKNIFAECSLQTVIDIHESKNGECSIGIIGIATNERVDQKVRAIVRIEGCDVFNINAIVRRGEVSKLPINIPVSKLRKEETYSQEVECIVLDSEESTIMSRISSLQVLSKYDLDLCKIVRRTAEFVNPLDPSVHDFVDNRNGPLSKAMGKDYIVSGYMVPDKILAQLDAVYRAVRDYGMSYVSDTNTMESGFQRVRTPSKVLNDHTGNCIEFSILFASILEAMGMEPVVIFPYGHAIPGVVLRADCYRSEAEYPPSGCKGVLKFRTDNGRSFEAVFFESTWCSHKHLGFKEAVDCAYKALSEEFDFIQSNQQFTIVTKLRNEGVKPTIG